MKKTGIFSPQIIDDFVMEMEHKGIDRETIQNILNQVIDEVEEEVVIELNRKLSDVKKHLLDALIAQGVDSEEIARQLEIDPEELEELENEKFSEIIEELTSRL